MNVLLVEDNQVNQLVAIGILKKIGVSYSLASNGKEAVELVSRSSFDLVLMDCAMPIMDGYQATKKIRKLEVAWKKLPIIAMTAHAMVGDRDISLQAGMNEHITKPISLKKINEILKQYL
jgi:CheY-like chemotaxis protein